MARWKLRAGIMTICLILAACAQTPPAATAPAPTPQAAPPAAEVMVLREGETWHAEFTFNQPAPVWAFRHSALLREGRSPWRPGQLNILTPGVVLDHAGGRDVLRTEDGSAMPETVEAELFPASVGVEASYNPALVFTDGAVALFSDQFDMVPVASLEAASELPADFTQAGLPDPDVRVTWRDTAGPVLLQGQRQDAPATRSADTYVLFGTPPAEETERFAVIADAALPAHVRELILITTPQLLELYAARTALSPPVKPMILASWNGPTPELRSMGGSVMPGLIAVAFEGEGVVNPADDLSRMVKLFLAHEAAHFWMGQIASYGREADMWITEGGAELMAARALESIDPEFDVKGFLQAAVDDCATLSASGPLATAGERGEHRAFYACGTVFAMVAEGFAGQSRQQGWLELSADLLRQNAEDKTITQEDWLAMLVDVSARPDIAAAMKDMVHEGTPAPEARLAEMLSAAGIAHHLADDRVLLD